jgi:uncharacterized membrane protein
MLEALGFFALVEAIGLAAVPLAGLAFGRLPGAGLGFAKPLGLLLVTWAVWMAASVTPLPYGVGTVVGALVVLTVAGVLAAARQRALAARLTEARGGWWARRRGEWAAARALPRDDPERRRMWIGSEVVFALSFAAMALLVAYSPDVWGTEKPMDMAFVNAANASSSFPPHDPWMAGEDLNYYYLGHLAMWARGRTRATTSRWRCWPACRRPRCSRWRAPSGRPPGRAWWACAAGRWLSASPRS